jgi:hypothetical protein
MKRVLYPLIASALIGLGASSGRVQTLPLGVSPAQLARLSRDLVPTQSFFQAGNAQLEREIRALLDRERRLKQPCQAVPTGEASTDDRCCDPILIVPGDNCGAPPQSPPPPAQL